MLGRPFPAIPALLTLALACTGEDPAPTEPRFDGLSADVEVRVDDMGIAHLYGATDADVFHAAGYQMATDRLFQMDWMRRRANGRLAEVFGEDELGQDKLMRMLGFSRWAVEDAAWLERESPEVHRLLVAWVAGVNRRIDEIASGDAPLPYGFGPGELDYMPEPWTIRDPLAVLKMILFGNQNGIEKEMLASIVRKHYPTLLDQVQLLKPMYPAFTVPAAERPAATSGPAPVSLPWLPRDAAPLPEGAADHLRAMRRTMSVLDLQGSNNWAIAGQHTFNGRPLIAGDPHQQLMSPSLMYALHMSTAESGGDLDVAGFSFVGVPGVHLGHNRHIAWTATNSFPDTMDIWEVTRVDGTHIRLGDTVHELVARQEQIRVRGYDNPIPVRLREVPGQGVILDDADILPSGLVTMRSNTLLLLNWVGFRGTPEMHALVVLDKAKSLDDFEAAASFSKIAAFNFVAADATGIAYRVSLDVPKRQASTSRPLPWLTVDGDDPTTLWTGEMLPPDMLPHTRNPAQGYIVTANNDPWGFTADGSVENDPWYYGAFYAPGFRAKRIEDRIGELIARGDVTVEDMQALQMDVHSGLSDELVPRLVDAWSRVPTDPALAAFRDRADLATLVQLIGTDWDRRMARDSAGALAFHAFALHLSARLLADELDIVYEQAVGLNAVYVLKMVALALTDQYPRAAEVQQEGGDVLVMTALADTAALLTERFGGVEATRYRWGDVHGTDFDAPFDGRLAYGFVSSEGGEDTVLPSGSSFYADGRVADRFASHQGPIFRIVSSFDDDGTPRAVVNFPIGNSADPDSPHFSDRLADWVEGRYRPLVFRRAEVETATESMHVLAAGTGR